MSDTIYIIAWIVFIAFFTTMAIISHIVDRRERKKKLEEWAEFEKIFMACFHEKEEEYDPIMLSDSIEAYPNNDTREIEIKKVKR